MRLISLLLPLALIGSPAFAFIEIFECGIEVGAGDTAYLADDLDCSQADSEAVILSDGARLVLGGHRIVSNPGEDDRRAGVRCVRGSICTIVGPGEITGFSASGIAGTRVRARDVTVTGNAVAGIIAYENIHLNNVVAEGNGVVDIHAGGRIVGQHPTALECDDASMVESNAPRFRAERRSRDDG